MCESDKIGAVQALSVPPEWTVVEGRDAITKTFVF